MDTRIEELTRNLKKNEGANEFGLNQVKQISGLKLPDQYLEFMKVSNGVEGSIGETSYLVLWPIEELIEANQDLVVDEFAPGLFIFGSDGGNTAYAFDTRSEKMPIVEVPLVGMDVDEVTPCGTTFVDFLRYLYSAEA